MVGTWWEHDPFLMGLPVWGEGGDLSEREGGRAGDNEHQHLRVSRASSDTSGRIKAGWSGGRGVVVIKGIAEGSLAAHRSLVFHRRPGPR